MHLLLQLLTLPETHWMHCWAHGFLDVLCATSHVPTPTHTTFTPCSSPPRVSAFGFNSPIELQGCCTLDPLRYNHHLPRSYLKPEMSSWDVFNPKQMNEKKIDLCRGTPTPHNNFNILQTSVWPELKNTNFNYFTTCAQIHMMKCGRCVVLSCLATYKRLQTHIS